MVKHTFFRKKIIKSIKTVCKNIQIREVHINFDLQGQCKNGDTKLNL